MAKATKSSLSPEKAAYYDEREKQLQKEIRSAKNWMWWIAFICVVPGVILVFVFRDTSILTFTAVIGIIGVIAEGICGHISEKKLDALKRERVFGNQQQ